MANLHDAIEQLKADTENLNRVMEYYGVVIDKNQCKCPFHADGHPSMGLKGGKYKCFTESCQASGDLIDFIRAKEGISILEAVKKAIDILSLPITVEKDKLDKLKDYIEREMSTWYKDNEYKLDGIYFFKDANNTPKLVRIKYKNFETKKKQFSQASIVDCGDYYKLDFKSEKVNLIYNMPRVIKNIQENKQIFLVEGEKDADNLNRLGFVATTCREITSVKKEVLEVLYNSHLVVLNDNDEAGRNHLNNIRFLLKDNVKSFKNLWLSEIVKKDDSEKADISDFIQQKFEEGLCTRDIRNIIISKLKRTLDECNENELQQNKRGIYKTTYRTVGRGEEAYQEKVITYLTNFNVQSLIRIENIDTEEEIIELKLISDLGIKKTIRAKSNKIFLDSKSFNSFMNMDFYFDGKPKDLNLLKAWINKYFLVEKRNEYLITGIREIDNKKMLVTSTGALLKNGDIDENYKADNHVTKIDYSDTKRLTKEQAVELSRHLFSFNSKKNCINIIGSLVSHMFNSVYRETKGKNLHITSFVGESGSGKSFTIDNITRVLLGLDNESLMFSGVTPHGLLRTMNDTMLTTIIDEVKPSQTNEYRKQLLSNTIRYVTGESTVVKGMSNQSVKTYHYNSSLIIAGEETLDETAIKNRCNIIWFSCNDMTSQTLENGNYFLTREGKEALKALGMEIYLYIMNEYNDEILENKLELIEKMFKEDKIHARIQATFNNTMLGYVTVKHILSKIGGSEVELENEKNAAKLIYQNLKDNVLEGEFATKQAYEEILEAIDQLAGSSSSFGISEDFHYRSDMLTIKLDIKAIFPLLESSYKQRGKKLPLDQKTFVNMLTKSKYVRGTSKDYYKQVKLNGRNKRCYVILKEDLKHLDMPILNPQSEWEAI